MKKNFERNSRNSAKKGTGKSANRGANNQPQKKFGRQKTAFGSDSAVAGVKIGTVMHGKIEGTGKNFAFFVPETGEGDLFITGRDLNGAIHGDTVDVIKISQEKGNGEGRVQKITERKYEQFVGTAQKGFIKADLNGLGTAEIVSAGSKVDYKDGDKVVARVIDTGRFFTAAVTEVLGKAGDLDTEVMAVIRTFDLYEDFPKAVLKEADAVPEKVSEEDIKGRSDFRKQKAVTIDGKTSKDFDDSVYVEETEDGYKLFVHIADVAQYVKPGSQLDKEAFKRGTSVYFADRVLPMLPERLSNGICSLNEGVDRLVLSVEMDFDRSGNLTAHKITEGVMRSAARLVYEDIAALLNGDTEMNEKYKDLAPMLRAAEKLAAQLNIKRVARGSVEFDISECEIIIENGQVVDIKKRERLVSHRMIEEFMLIANEVVAEHFVKKQVPFVYRVHEKPPEEKLDGLNGFLDSLGIKFTDKPSPADYAKLLGGSQSEELKEIISRVALRSMSKARYAPECLGHFGLSAGYYCHFTSPIRRYPDLAIHRLIKIFLNEGAKSLDKYKDFVEKASLRSSEREKIAEDAERKVDDFLKAKYMSGKIGEEFEGTISGVTERGVFVELDNGTEGMIHAEDLPGGNYVFNEKLYALTSGLNTYAIGRKMKIRVQSVLFDKVNFVPAVAEDKIKE